ncbi:hypothetical protein BDZ91DRAFT_446022 [Kalaharituber pfeilii]|nr:hypothetical protein BDZ91DRAFT_446022 [Kalaharituber pfeilii]
MSLSARVGLNQVVNICSFRVCCWYECSPFASRHLHCWRPDDESQSTPNLLLIYILLPLPLLLTFLFPFLFITTTTVLFKLIS